MILFDHSQVQFQSFGAISVLGIDSISLWLIWLVNMLMPIVYLSIYKSQTNLKIVSILIAMITFWSIAVFMVLDIVLFYISFEGVLIPLYFLIILGGSRNRKVHASYMFFLYTLIGSLFLFLALLGIYLEYGTGDYLILSRSLNVKSDFLLWIAFFICFAIKLPIVGFHTWLLAAHVESPTAGSVILAAILLKMGSYGLIRYSITLFPKATQYFRPFVIVLCLISILYSSIAALSQSDMKIIIAYSSISHMATSTLGLFSNDLMGIQGSIYFLISHGIISSALFLLVGVLYDRFHTRVLFYYRGLVQVYPIYVTILLIFSMANSAIPLTSGFIAEFLSLLGAFHLNPLVALIASLSIVIVPAFMLNLTHRIAYGIFTPYMPFITNDLTRKEIQMFIPLLSFMIILGIYPKIILDSTLSEAMLLLQI